MSLLRILLAGAAVAVIATAFRDQETGDWTPQRSAPPEGDDALEEEPVLGYDGMDRDTLMAWLRDADFDDVTLQRIRRYEVAHQNRAVVLDTVDNLLGR